MLIVKDVSNVWSTLSLCYGRCICTRLNIFPHHLSSLVSSLFFSIVQFLFFLSMLLLALANECYCRFAACAGWWLHFTVVILPANQSCFISSSNLFCLAFFSSLTACPAAWLEYFNLLLFIWISHLFWYKKMNWL